MKRIIILSTILAAVLAVSLTSLFVTTGAVRHLIKTDRSEISDEIEESEENEITLSGSLENQGWQHVAAARSTGDTAHYRRAMAIAKQLESEEETIETGMLLRSHLLHQQHRFSEALNIAQELCHKRGMHCDYGLLGDILLDLGDVDEAINAYGKQMAQRPSLEAYARAAQARWIKGQLHGAIEAMTMAVGAGSSRNPEPLVWVLSQLALLHLQAGEENEAEIAISAALRLDSGHTRALTTQARLLISRKEFSEAANLLNKVIIKSPEPAAMWLLVECLNETSETDRADRIRKGLILRGKSEDPRTVSLFLATHHLEAELALTLAQQEINLRQDIFSHDALAWAAHNSGNLELAKTHMKLALKEGTEDARLSFHAGTIALADGDLAEAKEHFEHADRVRQMLLPSEGRQLDNALSSLNSISIQLSLKK